MKTYSGAASEGGACDYGRSHELARRAAASCAVLMKNERGILPLKRRAGVVFIGDMAAHPRYQGSGQQPHKPEKTHQRRRLLRGHSLGAGLPGGREHQR